MKDLKLPVAELYELLRNFPDHSDIILNDKYNPHYEGIEAAISYLYNALEIINEIEAKVEGIEI